MNGWLLNNSQMRPDYTNLKAPRTHGRPGATAAHSEGGCAKTKAPHRSRNLFAIPQMGLKRERENRGVRDDNHSKNTRTRTFERRIACVAHGTWSVGHDARNSEPPPRQKMNVVSRKAAHTVAELASARQHQKLGRPSWSVRWRVNSELPSSVACFPSVRHSDCLSRAASWGWLTTDHNFRSQFTLSFLRLKCY